mgnify:CR=1 FL=1
MALFSKQSLETLDGVHPLLVEWAHELIQVIDFKVVSGVRTRATQMQYVSRGVSKTMNSKHLIQKDGYSHALDLAPYPVDWSDLRRFYILAGAGLGIADQLNIPMTWGGRWNPLDDRFKVPSFNDLGHFQINL